MLRRLSGHHPVLQLQHITARAGLGPDQGGNCEGKCEGNCNRCQWAGAPRRGNVRVCHGATTARDRRDRGEMERKKDMTGKTIRQLAVATLVAVSATMTLDTMRSNAQALQARVHSDAQFKAQMRADTERNPARARPY